MLIIESVLLLRQHIRRLRQEGKRIALVPTMGNLHDGHMKLVDEAKASADVVVVSIFVNPMQFDRVDDLARYPRTLQDDCEKLNKRHVDFVFAPTPAEVYPQGTEGQTYVDVPGLSTMLEGASRPGHFRGVSTIVSKLFNLVQPDVACFGEKDFPRRTLASRRKKRGAKNDSQVFRVGKKPVERQSPSKAQFVEALEVGERKRGRKRQLIHVAQKSVTSRRNAPFYRARRA